MCFLWLLLALAVHSTAYPNPSELEKVAKDRPQLETVVDRGSLIWVWLDQHFRNTNGLPVIWSPGLPNLPRHYLSSHRYNEKGQAIILVVDKTEKGDPIQGEEFLSMLVYELLNATHRDQFMRLDELAGKHEIKKEKYVEEMARIEHATALEVKQFRVKFWVPNAVQKHLAWDNPYWKQGTFEDFDVYLRTVRAMHEAYPDDAFGPRFDYYFNEGVRQDVNSTNQL